MYAKYRGAEGYHVQIGVSALEQAAFQAGVNGAHDGFFAKQAAVALYGSVQHGGFGVGFPAGVFALVGDICSGQGKAGLETLRGKLAGGVYDTSVTMAAKAHLRNNRPIVIAVSTNDALGASAKNIGALLNMKNYYFVPMRQDDPVKKPTSVVADFSKTEETVELALRGEQIQPILI